MSKQTSIEVSLAPLVTLYEHENNCRQWIAPAVPGERLCVRLFERLLLRREGFVHLRSGYAYP